MLPRDPEPLPLPAPPPPLPAPPIPPPDENPAEKPISRFRDFAAVAVACVALTGFGVFILALLFMLDLKEVNWTRALYLLNGVEAIAFAAAGYLFGREVNRGRAQNAEQLATSEKKRANKAEAQGQALADVARGLAGESRGQAPGLESIRDPDQRLQVLAELCNTLFPPRGTEGRP